MRLKNLTPQQISDYRASQYPEMNQEFEEEKLPFTIKVKRQAVPPNPPTPEMVERAQFKDKTYIWKHAGVRSRDERVTK